MRHIEVIEASVEHSFEVSELVKSLLIELEPTEKEAIENAGLDLTANSMIESSNVRAFLARVAGQYVGVITLHECAAIYAGGIFGEISELYVVPEYRSLKVGETLVSAAIEKGRTLNWKRLEVGSPPAESSGRTLNFYQENGFVATGVRLKRVLE